MSRRQFLANSRALVKRALKVASFAKRRLRLATRERARVAPSAVGSKSSAKHGKPPGCATAARRASPKPVRRQRAEKGEGKAQPLHKPSQKEGKRGERGKGRRLAVQCSAAFVARRKARPPGATASSPPKRGARANRRRRARRLEGVRCIMLIKGWRVAPLTLRESRAPAPGLVGTATRRCRRRGHGLLRVAAEEEEDGDKRARRRPACADKAQATQS